MNDMSRIPPEGTPDKLASLELTLANLRKWRPQIEVALRHGAQAQSFDDLLMMVMRGTVQFYSFEKSFLVMEIINYPQFKVYHCFLAGGDMRDVFESEARMLPNAKALGCKYLSIAGRKGWTRMLKPRGWKFVCATMYKEVEYP